jgi:glycosyltransferase involved in cell wall biosynthesis
MPLVSVITPSFNQGRYLGATLESVAIQDYPRIEHIVMDGGSTDGSVAILENWARRHPLNWRSAPDAGQADAIRRGIEASSGEIIAWLNSDDVYLSPDVVSSAVAEFVNGASVVTGGGWYVSESGTRLKRIPTRHKRLSHQKLRDVDWVLQPATFVRRDLMLSHPLDIDLTYAFDWDLFIRLSAHTAFTPVDSAWAGYRLHESAKTTGGGARRRQELIHVTRRYHGRSWRYGSLRLFDLLCRATEALPWLPRAVASRGLRAVARLSNDLTDGSGLPFHPAAS